MTTALIACNLYSIHCHYIAHHVSASRTYSAALQMCKRKIYILLSCLAAYSSWARIDTQAAYDPRRVFRFNLPRIDVGPKAREVGTYISGALVRLHSDCTNSSSRSPTSS